MRKLSRVRLPNFQDAVAILKPVLAAITAIVVVIGTVLALTTPGRGTGGTSSTTTTPTTTSQSAPSTSVDPDPEPKKDPVPDAKNVATPRTDLLDQYNSPISTWEPRDDTSIWVNYWGGSRGCFGEYFTVEETDTTVKVTVIEGWLDGNQSCSMEASQYKMAVPLSKPLGDRKIIGSDGKEIRTWESIIRDAFSKYPVPSAE